MKKVLFMTMVLLFIPSLLFAGERKYSEKQYQELWCGYFNGQTEARMDDNTRCDCITDEYAVEVDYSDKWYEAIGQSLHYAWRADKKAGIVIIIEDDSDYKYFERVKGVVEHYGLPITIWLINAKDVEESLK